MRKELPKFRHLGYKELHDLLDAVLAEIEKRDYERKN